MKSRHLITAFVLMLVSSFSFAEEISHPQSLEEALASTFTIRFQAKDGNFSGIGSGWLADVSSYGLSGCYIVTNDHVVTKMTDDNKREIARIHVVQYKKRLDQKWTEFQRADIVYQDKRADIAILKVKSCDGLKRFKIKIADAVHGSPVYALGSPLGFSQSVSDGVVAYPSRLLRSREVYVQTSAEINPGNSGGPLVDRKTFSVVGMNTLIIGRTIAYSTEGTATTDGLGFAVRAASVHQAFKDYVTIGKPSYPSFGFSVQATTSDILGLYRYPQTFSEILGCRGLLVLNVSEDFAVSTAGLKEDDILVSINGKCVNSEEDLYKFVASTSAGDASKFRVWRLSDQEVKSFYVRPTETFEGIPVEESEYSESQTRYEGLLGFEIEYTDEYPTDKPVFTKVYAYSEAFWENMLLVLVRSENGSSMRLPVPQLRMPVVRNGLKNQGAVFGPERKFYKSFQELEAVYDTSGRQLEGQITQESLEKFAAEAMASGSKIALKVRFVVLKSVNYTGTEWEEDTEFSGSRMVFLEPKAYQE